MKKIIKSHISEHIKLINNNYDEISDCIEMITKEIKRTLKNKKTIFFAGNGGSAADCEHLAGELVGRYKKNRKPYKAISLAADVGTITCIANDFGYENIFSRQLDALGNKNDLVVAISTSGNSKNIINLLKMSKSKKVYSIGFFGNQGGKSKKLCNYPIIINSKNTARIQEMHQIIYHNICNLIDQKKFKK